MASAVDLSVAAIPTNSSEWAELIVKEMSSALDLADAKNRAFRILDLLEKSAARSRPGEKSKVNKVSRLPNVKILLYNGTMLNPHFFQADLNYCCQSRSTR